MNFDNIAQFSLNTVIISVIICILTCVAKFFWKKLLSAESDAKKYSDKLRELCFLTEAILSFGISAIFVFLLSKEDYNTNTYITVSLSSLSCAEVIYTAYESIGLKAVVKLLLEKLKLKKS